MKESHEELGLDRQVFARAPLHELGARLFSPRDGSTPFEINWYVMEATPKVLAGMDPNPSDAHAVKWFKMSEVAELIEAGKINANYPAVLAEAIVKLRTNELKPAQFAESAQPTR